MYCIFKYNLLSILDEIIYLHNNKFTLIESLYCSEVKDKSDKVEKSVIEEVLGKEENRKKIALFVGGVAVLYLIYNLCFKK